MRVSGKAYGGVALRWMPPFVVRFGAGLGARTGAVR